MDTFTFIIEMVRAIVWPIVVSIGLFVLHKPLLNLVPFLEELKFKEFSLRFHRQVTEAKEKAEENQITFDIQPPEAAEQDALIRIARLSPRAAVMEAWRFLETALLDILIARGQIDSKDGYRGNSRLGHAMLNIKAFNQMDFELFHKLLKLRNEATHAPEFALSTTDAEEYVLLAIGLVNRSKNRGV